ncbi:hypothetical protein BLOT_006360 [Blomia tropicalis]|nr:hypothetical protein BLOT_006360 [Blomia tropicalis]
MGLVRAHFLYLTENTNTKGSSDKAIDPLLFSSDLYILSEKPATTVLCQPSNITRIPFFPVLYRTFFLIMFNFERLVCLSVLCTPTQLNEMEN